MPNFLGQTPSADGGIVHAKTACETLLVETPSAGEQPLALTRRRLGTGLVFVETCVAHSCGPAWHRRGPTGAEMTEADCDTLSQTLGPDEFMVHTFVTCPTFLVRRSAEMVG